MIDIYCVSLKVLPRLHKYLKMQTQLDVSKKSKRDIAPSCGQSTIVVRPFAN